MKLQKILKRIVVLLVVVVCLISNSSTVHAFSSTQKTKLPNTTYYLQSNVWQSNTLWWSAHEFKVSAKLYTSSECTTIAKASTIKTTWTYTPYGVAVSTPYFSAGIPTGNGFTGSWTNTNAWISDMSGTYKNAGGVIYSTLSNSAMAVKDGVKATVMAECLRLY